MIVLDQKMSGEIALEVAQRVRKRRKEMRLTQEQMALKAGMSLASYKRFEQKGLVSFDALIRIAIACRCEEDFDQLFSRRHYASIQEVIDEQRAASRR